MSLWIDKYRPKQLSALSYHDGITQQLKTLASSGDVPHLLFYGPPGAGKKTRVQCFLRELYGASTDKLKIEHRSFKATPSKTVDISTIASGYHIEINPSDVGIDDYHVVRLLLKEIASSPQLDTSHHAFKVVVISEADRLTRKAQQALRRIMEKYVHNCRYVLIGNSSSKILAPIRSRCLGLRVGAPSVDELSTVLIDVGKKEGCQVMPGFAAKVANASSRNLRRALLMLEATASQSRGSKVMEATNDIQLPDWEIFLRETAKRIISQQSPQRLLEVRQRLYELLSHCIPPDVIIKRLTEELIGHIDGQLKVDVIAYAADFEHRLTTGRKPIFHLEAFVARFMSVYKAYLMDLM
ncbi:replication factor C subunit 3 [Salpingoeca rosetta]|uniref:Replication factor C subunit 3 n=1 Tax=Salpingoeca rosetta (strain ATCC 50818 / BSB-021) TaxID=946362 RepID=F2UE75_SALR5|nr:replication factor C subunit 3 [Salpingoeca rosetta]EGD74925.1 replication factor C subunit 3 [Salpingoeca rosetta]|eukprot:XP_004992570.1 replication factor C subunit 3 [Salpingoeca rosetta]